MPARTASNAWDLPTSTSRLTARRRKIAQCLQETSWIASGLRGREGTHCPCSQLVRSSNGRRFCGCPISEFLSWSFMSDRPSSMTSCRFVPQPVYSVIRDQHSLQRHSPISSSHEANFESGTSLDAFCSYSSITTTTDTSTTTIIATCTNSPPPPLLLLVLLLSAVSSCCYKVPFAAGQHEAHQQSADSPRFVFAV